MLTRAAICSPDTHQKDLRTETLAQLSGFRSEFYACLTARADELFELTDALLCTAGPVTTLVDLALAPEHRRGHGALYGGLNELPVIEGTLIRLSVERLPGDAHPRPVWLWSSALGLPAAQVDLLWQAFLRRFDLEHTFRLWKQTLGWTAPKTRSPQAADRWTWLIIAGYTQLRLARYLLEDLRRPWERPALPGRLSPARVRRGFRNIRPATSCPARAPKPGKPGPGRPPGSRKQRRAPATTWGKSTSDRSPSQPNAISEVKQQAQRR